MGHEFPPHSARVQVNGDIANQSRFVNIVIQLTPARDDDRNARSATLPKSKEIEGNHGVA